jgi:hypothetical protein
MPGDDLAGHCFGKNPHALFIFTYKWHQLDA